MGEFNEILVDRISPQDARSLAGFDGVSSLKGVGFGHFAGFLSRGYRENDYLLGRLHALDRLIDIVCDAAGVDRQADGVERVTGRHPIGVREFVAANAEAFGGRRP